MKKFIYILQNNIIDPLFPNIWMVIMLTVKLLWFLSKLFKMYFSYSNWFCKIYNQYLNLCNFWACFVICVYLHIQYKKLHFFIFRTLRTQCGWKSSRAISLRKPDAGVGWLVKTIVTKPYCSTFSPQVKGVFIRVIGYITNSK